MRLASQGSFTWGSKVGPSDDVTGRPRNGRSRTRCIVLDSEVMELYSALRGGMPLFCPTMVLEGQYIWVGAAVGHMKIFHGGSGMLWRHDFHTVGPPTSQIRQLIDDTAIKDTPDVVLLHDPSSGQRRR